MQGCPTSVTEITPGLLLKDAAYGAAAHVYYELSNYLSFKDWYCLSSQYCIDTCSIDVVPICILKWFNYLQVYLCYIFIGFSELTRKAVKIVTTNITPGHL